MIRHWMQWLGALGMMASLAACDGAKAPASGQVDWRSATGKPEIATIEIGSEPGVLYLPVLAAQDQGYFKAEGLEVKLTPIKAAPESLAALAGGSFAFAPMSFFYVFALDKSRPVELDYVAGMDQLKGGGSFVVLPASGIKSPKDLEGKKIAVPSLNSACDLSGGSVLADVYHVDLKSIKFVELGGPDIPAALERGTVDAACTSQTMVAKLALSMKAQVVANIQEGATEQAPILAWWASRKFTQKNPNTTAAFRRAVNKGSDWVNHHEAEARRMLVERFKLPEALAQKVTMPTFGEANIDAVGTEARLMEKSGSVANINVKEILGLR